MFGNLTKKRDMKWNVWRHGMDAQLELACNKFDEINTIVIIHFNSVRLKKLKKKVSVAIHARSLVTPKKYQIISRWELPKLRAFCVCDFAYVNILISQLRKD